MFTIERLKEVLNYDPLSGIFVWKISLTNSVPAGSIAGTEHNKGYLYVGIDGVKFYLHRLAWFYMTGEWPIEIDHEDLNKKNNVWTNLRKADRVSNGQNVKVKAVSSTGVKNVYFEERRNKYRVSVRANGKRNFVGYYLTLDEAEDAAEKFMIENHKDFFNM